LDCISKLNQAVYSNSEISNKVTCAGTKNEAIVNNVLAPHLDLNDISYLDVSTDGSSHGSLNYFLL
jgi:hypothetical protein